MFQNNPLGAIQQAEEPLDIGSAFAASHGQLEETSSQFRQLVQYQSTLRKVQAGLDELAALRDTVTLDDVVKTTGELVSHGLDPAQMAGLLADAPEGGEALAAWIAQKAEALAKRNEQLAPVLQQTQHQLGVQSMQVLALDSAMPHPEEQAAAQPNALGAAPAGGM